MIKYNNLIKAYKSLNQCYEDYANNPQSVFIEYITDACVKRFEYTLEVAWKLAKKVLIQKYGKNEEELSMNNIFRFMEGYGYTLNWKNWKNYYQKRNNTAHEYDFYKSRTLILTIPSFLADVRYFIDKLNKESDEN